jgi:phage I-like protein
VISRVLCSATLDAGEVLPTEFVLFRSGVTETEQGPFTVDVARVAEAQRKYGVRLMIDSEHASLDDAVFQARGDARDALGYFDLDVRPDGSVWAVNVLWTPAGEERLRSRKAVYISPAFLTDEDSRVIKIVNAALTSMPATHGAPALVAARNTRATFDSTKVSARARALAYEARSILENGSRKS